MHRIHSSETEPIQAAQAAGRSRRFPVQATGQPPGPRRFSPDQRVLADTLGLVRALDADTYQALLWALGLTPDPRLSVPGCSRRRPARAEPAGA